MRPLHIPLTSGLPDAGAPGQWLGRDKHGAVYSLRWMPQKQCFGALGWSATHPKQPWPQLVLLRGEQEGFIIGHVEGPAIDPTSREGFLMAALADLVAQDRAGPATIPPHRISGSAGRVALVDEIEAEPAPVAPAWSPWLWTVAMLFGLPAAALAIVAFVASAPKAGGKPAAPVHTQERTNG